MARTSVRSSNRNPLAIDPAREQRIRERAYHLWEADGKPHGRDVEYWERARELIGMEDSAGGGLLPKPKTARGFRRQTGVEGASIQATEGERKTASAAKQASRVRSKKPV